MEPMDSWGKMKEQKLLLPETEFIALCRNLYTGWENFLADKLRLREDQSLVLEVLTALATPRAQEILLKCLEDREEAVQLAAAEALKKMPPARILRPLAAAMLRQSQGAAKAGEVLAALGPKGLDQLWQLWFEEGAAESLKTQVLLLLAEQADPRCENLAFLALLSQDEELVRAAMWPAACPPKAGGSGPRPARSWRRWESGRPCRPWSKGGPTRTPGWRKSGGGP